jgi:hypothetical protein
VPLYNVVVPSVIVSVPFGYSVIVGDVELEVVLLDDEVVVELELEEDA